MRRPFSLGIALLSVLLAFPVFAQLGYFRFPALSGDSLAFVAEGDLWRGSVRGGQAQRLTSHPGDESFPAISPDGQWVAYSARYEGPMEIYAMPIAGGTPKRLTYDGALMRGCKAGHPTEKSCTAPRALVANR